MDGSSPCDLLNRVVIRHDGFGNPIHELLDRPLAQGSPSH
jgi:hypothetical protein